MKFEKVSFEQYANDCGYQLDGDLLTDFIIEHDKIELPSRATVNSSGYDFKLPCSLDIEPFEEIKVPTGIRWVCDNESDHNKVLQIFPRSGLGFKFQLGLANTVGIIDADYYVANNEGHIIIKLVNRGERTIHLNQGDGFAQGIILEYHTVDNEKVPTEIRTGGFGSTTK